MDSRATYPRDKNQKWAIYTRYPDGFYGKSAEDLKCPECGAEEIVILEEFSMNNERMLGDTAQCWLCKHVFNVTEKCWHWREVEQ